MVNKKSMNAINTPAEPSSGSERNKVLTKRLMLGMALTLRRGLTTLRTLRPLSRILKRKKSITLLFWISLILPWKHDNEVNKVPSISEVGKFVEDKPHGGNLKPWFHQKYDCEAITNIVECLIILIIWISISEIEQRQHNGISNDAQHYEPVKPSIELHDAISLLPLYKPDEAPSEFTSGLQAKEGTLRIEDTLPMNIKMAFEVTEFLLLDILNEFELLAF